MKIYVIAIGLALLTGCNSSGDLVGSWTLDQTATSPKGSNQPAAKALVTTLQFTSDGKYETFIKTSQHDKGETDEGTYTVSGHEITTTIEGRSNTVSYQIKDKKLVLDQDGETLIFRRQ